MNTGSQPLSVSSLSLHNPSRLSDDEIVATFAARQAVFERVLEDIRSEKPRGRPQHHLLVGQRGMGKSTLLARLAAEIRRVPELSRTLIPLAFAEEQYAVDRLSKFWLNCLDSLADAAERDGDLAAVSRIDGVVGRFAAGPGRTGQEEKDLASATMDAFLDEAGKLGRRPVLLVDNLQLVFDRTTPEEQHVLREFLMRPGAPVLVGTSPSPPVQSQDYGAPFYDHFKVHYLRALSVEEMKQLMLVLAEKADRPDVTERIVRHPHRLQVLHQLSGGNPRTAVTLFFLYAEDFAPSVFGDLENLLDRVTPLYKARFEELAPQQQVVASAIAHHWDPIPAREISDATGLPPSAISAQLDRLDKTGFVERVELFGDTRTGYQIAERFFNVWFLMRSASRRQRREVEFLTRFIESFYEAQDRSRLALQIQAERDLSPDRHVFTEALACTLDEGLAHDVRRHAAVDALRQKDPGVRRRLAEVFEFDRVPRLTIAFADLASKLLALVPVEAGIEPGEFVRLVLGDPEMFISGERERLAGQPSLSPDSVRKLVARLRHDREDAVATFGVAAMDWLARRLQTGQLAALDQQDDWKAALGLAPDSTALHVILRIMPASICHALLPEIERRLERDLSPSEEPGAMAWINRAWVLQATGNHPREAEAAYRTAIELESNDAWSWACLGALLSRDAQRYAEAEAAFRRAIELNAGDWSPWWYLANLLEKRPGNTAAATQAREKALQCLTPELTRKPMHYASLVHLENLFGGSALVAGAVEAHCARQLEANPGNEESLLNLLFLRRDLRGDITSARPLLDRLAYLPVLQKPDLGHLHRA